jgi:hypothetical protein
MTKPCLAFDEESQLEQLVLASIRSRYFGELERSENAQTLDVTYKPLNGYVIHELMTDLWGEYITPAALASLTKQLCEDGADYEEWGEDAFCAVNDDDWRRVDEWWCELRDAANKS